jgi:hypothetical protein
MAEPLAGRAEAADMPIIPIPTAKQAESRKTRMLVPFIAASSPSESRIRRASRNQSYLSDS